MALGANPVYAKKEKSTYSEVYFCLCQRTKLAFLCDELLTEADVLEFGF